jgi:exopolysaccharide biosynthesis WecB/TagA/CpsF family protein
MQDEFDNMWPRKHDILGIDVSATTYDQAIDTVIHAAKAQRSACVSHLAVHGLVEGSRDTRLRSMLNEFDIVAPDGQPVRLALNLLYKTKLPDRCYGPEFMMRVCQSAATEKIGVYIYGSYKHVVDGLADHLISRFPELRILGSEPSVFRPLSKSEDDALVCRICESGAGIVFLGLGCPLQEKFAYEHKGKIKAIQICVGAAFDFHSGNKKMAPEWMQRHALEWFFRLSKEPRRLWRRYLVTNTIFLTKLFFQIIRTKKIHKPMKKKQKGVS